MLGLKWWLYIEVQQEGIRRRASNDINGASGYNHIVFNQASFFFMSMHMAHF